MIHVVESTKSVQEIEKLFPQVAAKYKFGVLGVHNLRQKMNEKGVPFDQDCMVFEVCNPHKAKSVLEGNMGVSTALPCRISVYQEKGTTKIATISPTVLLGLFGASALKSIAEEVERDLFKIMDDLV